MSAQNIFSENESNADKNLNNLYDKKIIGLLGDKFEDLKKVIDNRIKIRKEYSEKIGKEYQLIYDTQKEEDEDKNKDGNKNKIENFAILKNGLLESEEPEDYKDDLAKIRHNVIV